MPNVLLFGGHGKIAQRLTPLLLARSHNVVSVVRNPAHSAEIERLATGHPGNLRVLVSSLDYVHSDADASAVLDETRPDWVVWSAGKEPFPCHWRPALASAGFRLPLRTSPPHVH